MKNIADLAKTISRGSHYCVPCTSTCDGDQEIWSSKWGFNRLIYPLKLDRLIYLFWRLDRLISCNKRTHIQAYTIGHAHLPFMRSVRNQNVRKIAVADGSIGHTAVTTSCNILPPPPPPSLLYGFLIMKVSQPTIYFHQNGMPSTAQPFFLPSAHEYCQKLLSEAPLE